MAKLTVKKDFLFIDGDGDYDYKIVKGEGGNLTLESIYTKEDLTVEPDKPIVPEPEDDFDIFNWDA